MTPMEAVDALRAELFKETDPTLRAVAGSSPPGLPERGDLANVDRFVAEHGGRLRYVVERRRWLLGWPLVA